MPGPFMMTILLYLMRRIDRMIESDKMTDSLISHVRSGQLKRDVLPYHLVEHQPDKVILQTWEGRLVESENLLQ